jgi:hypothetical protein
MLISEEKIHDLSHVLVRELKSVKGFKLLKGEEAVVKEIQDIITGELRLDEQIDRHTRDKLASYSRRIPEGSQEWEILYRKFFEEELRRHRRL